MGEEWRAELDSDLVVDEGRENDNGRGGLGLGNVRVAWNGTGTVLSTAGDDAKVRLWKGSSLPSSLSSEARLIVCALDSDVYWSMESHCCVGDRGG